MRLPVWPRRTIKAPEPTLWGRYAADALTLAETMDIDPVNLASIRRAQPCFRWSTGRMSCNWFFQDVGAVTVGGVMTAFRIANQLRLRGVHQRFLIYGHADVQAVAQNVLAAFPMLRGSEFITLDSPEKIAAIPAADIGVATLWTTAYLLAKVRNCARKMYLIQDYEPLFYPAGSTAAQAELTYRFGFEGLCNTAPLAELYRSRYGGTAIAFTPQIDQAIFFPGPEQRYPPRIRVFFYARPDNPRNAFELGAVALRRLKRTMGEGVEILCAGAQFEPADFGLEGVVEPLGWLPLEQTGQLYRSCHVAVSCMLTPHPSYLPFELMACGVVVVSLRNDANQWLLEDGVTCLIAEATASSLAAKLHEAATEWSELAPMRMRAQARIAQVAGRGWDHELAQVVEFMLRPDGDAEAPAEPSELLRSH